MKLRVERDDSVEDEFCWTIAEEEGVMAYCRSKMSAYALMLSLMAVEATPEHKAIEKLSEVVDEMRRSTVSLWAEAFVVAISNEIEDQAVRDELKAAVARRLVNLI